MSEPTKKVKRLGLLWRFQTQENQRYAPLVEYLNDSNEDLPYPKTEMFLQAIAAFWYPFALQWRGRSEEEIKTAVIFAIKSLELHIALLKDHFKIVQSSETTIKEYTNVDRLVSSEVEREIATEQIDAEGYSVNDEDDLTDSWMKSQKSRTKKSLTS